MVIDLPVYREVRLIKLKKPWSFDQGFLLMREIAGFSIWIFASGFY
jgi:hypothetical protein